MLITPSPSQVRTFRDYVELYVKGQPSEEEDEDLPRKTVHEVVNPRWEVCVTASPSGFQQASFVNSIATTKVSRGILFTLVRVHARACTYLFWCACLNKGCCIHVHVQVQVLYSMLQIIYLFKLIRPCKFGVRAI